MATLRELLGGPEPDLQKIERHLDEVGIGPLAGPVVAAAVVMPPGAAIEGVHDSKTLTRKQRETLDVEIRSVALAIGLGVVSPELAKTLFLGLQDWIVRTFGWLFIGSTAASHAS